MKLNSMDIGHLPESTFDGKGIFAHSKGPSIKDVRRKRWGFVQCGQGGFFRCGRPLFLVQKFRIYRNLLCLHGQGRVEPERTREVNFSQFCADVFMDGL